MLGFMDTSFVGGIYLISSTKDRECRTMSDSEISKDDFIKLVKEAKLSEDTVSIISGMTDREIRVLCSRFNLGKDNIWSLESQIKACNVTRERIQDIEEDALKKIRNGCSGGDGPDVA